MRTALPQQLARKQSHRPRAVTVFAAAFIAGAAAAVGVNRALDVRLAQAKPRVESEAIFVALRSLPQGTPVTVWDVALRDWPKAMLPASALRAHDSFTGQVLKHPLREGQPLLAIQLMPATGETSGPRDAQPSPPPAAYTQVVAPVGQPAEADLWAPAEPAAPPPATAPAAPPATADAQAAAAVTAQPAPAPASNVSAAQEAVSWPQPVIAPQVAPPVVPTPAAAPVEAIASAPAVSASVEPEPEPVDEGVQPDAPQLPAAVVAAPISSEQPPADPVEVPTATQAPVEAAALPQSPTVVAEVVAPEPAAEPVSVVAPEPVAPARQPVAEAAMRQLPRYLVVPENIAVQADRSFAIPTTGMPPAQSQQPVPGPAGVQQLPPTTGATAATPRSQPSGQPYARPAAQPAQQRQAVGQEPRQQRQGRQPAPTNGSGNGGNGGPSSQPRLGAAMFPNISAGIDAIEGEWGRMRRDRTATAEQPAPRQQPVTAR